MESFAGTDRWHRARQAGDIVQEASRWRRSIAGRWHRSERKVLSTGSGGIVPEQFGTGQCGGIVPSSAFLSVRLRRAVAGRLHRS